MGVQPVSREHEPHQASEGEARARRLDILRALAASAETPAVTPEPRAEERASAEPAAAPVVSGSPSGALPSIGGRQARDRQRSQQARPATARTRAGTALIISGVTLLALIAVIGGYALLLNRPTPTGKAAPTTPHILSAQLANATVYFASNNGDASHFYALDALTGKRVWSFLFGSSYTTPIVSGSVVYTASSDGNVYALNTQTGRPLWVTSRPDRGDAYLALNGTTLYAVDDFGLVFAFDATSGKILWQVNGVSDHGINDVFYSPPAVANGVMVATVGRYPVGDGAIIAFDAATGAILWREPSAFAANGEPIIANGVVYVTASDGSITALDVATGATVWSARIGSSFNSGVAVSGTTLYAFAQNATMYAVNATTGAIIWNVSGKDTQGGYENAAPRVANGTVYFCSQSGNIFAVSARQGNVLWRSTVGAAIVSTPAVLDGALYFGDDEGNLYGMRAKDGVQAWVASLDTSSNASPAVAP